MKNKKSKLALTEHTSRSSKKREGEYEFYARADATDLPSDVPVRQGEEISVV